MLSRNHARFTLLKMETLPTVVGEARACLFNAIGIAVNGFDRPSRLSSYYNYIGVRSSILNGAPLRYRSANFLHIGGAFLEGLRQHMGVANETDNAANVRRSA